MFEYNTWVYYLAILLCGFGALVLNANQVEYSLIDATSGKGVKRQKQVYLVAFLLMGYIVFWAAIRNGIVDTAEYIYGYENITTNIDLKKIFASDQKAPLFDLYRIVLRRMGFNWQQYLASIAIISGFCIFYGISKYSDDVPFSMYLFITGLHFYWLFNGVRQFLVASIFFACFKWIVEKKLWKLLILVLILYWIHQTAWVIIPIYFIAF